MIKIQKIVLHNFKRFSDLKLDLNPNVNIFIGDNEAGKTTLLQAIDLVARGSRSRIEEIGLERLFNVNAVNSFMNGDKRIENLPVMFIELYLNEQNDMSVNGKNNSESILCDGIRMVCKPNDEFSEQIKHVLTNDSAFPFEFYSIVFDTFSGASFSGYCKKIKTIFIDNSQIGSPYAMNEYIRTIYNARITSENRAGIKHQYRNYKENFKEKVLDTYNDQNSNFAFALKNTPQANIETDITILSNNVPIENKGTGIQCFIKTELALQKNEDIDAVLIEEPESHLSYLKMLELIDKIANSKDRQLFIATHSDLIATRLDLRNCFFVNSNSNCVTSLKDISDDTARFFEKAPDNNLLRFILSKIVILVEGDAEYILMDAMFTKVTDKTLKESGVGVIAVDGKCFKRYLEIANFLKIKTAVITDNDGDYSNNIENNYKDYLSGGTIKVYADTNNENHTFEVCIYKANQELCNELFQTTRRSLEIQDYMLKNKSEAAFQLATKTASDISVPQYIKNAIGWING